MANSKLSDEILVAYVDGELAPERAAEVAAALADDADARQTVEVFRQSAEAAKNAYDAVASQPVPDRLLKAIGAPVTTDDAVVDLASRRRPARGWRAALPLAASIALIVGLGAGYLLARLAETPAGGFEMALNDILESHASGAPVAWRDPTGDDAGDITAVATFKGKSGLFCREFERSRPTAAGDNLAFGVACRATDGRWHVEALIAAQVQTPPGGDTYVPAAGPDNEPIDDLIDGLMAGGPLTPEEEKALIGNGWR